MSQIYVNTITPLGGTSGTLTINSNLSVVGSSSYQTLIISTTGGTANGGIIFSATGGAVIVQGIGATSNGIPSGGLWNDGGYLRIKP